MRGWLDDGVLFVFWGKAALFLQWNQMAMLQLGGPFTWIHRIACLKHTATNVHASGDGHPSTGGGGAAAKCWVIFFIAQQDDSKAGGYCNRAAHFDGSAAQASTS
jgi:hypothetical protein